MRMEEKTVRKVDFIMWVFRLALTVIFLVLVLLVGVIEHVITWAVGKFNPDACLRMRSEAAISAAD